MAAVAMEVIVVAAVIPIPITLASAEKAALIQAALQTLQAAHALDERTDNLNPASLVEWYDKTIPHVKDIKVLAGAMDVELAKRRGKQVKQEGERRGGDQSKVSQCDTLPNADKLQRSRDRVLATQPHVVDTYVKTEAEAGRVPSVRGAVRAVHEVRNATRSDRPPKSKRASRSGDVADTDSSTQTVALIDKVADGQFHTNGELERVLGTSRARRFFDKVALIPWLTIARTPQGATLTIHQELRLVCEWYGSRVLPPPAGVTPVLPPTAETSPRALMRAVLEEMKRQREANNDLYKARLWKNEAIDNRKMSTLFDWVVDQLRRIP
jgi:hypothetical protein